MKRPTTLTVVLVILAALNVIGLLGVLMGGDVLRQALASMPPWYMPVSILLTLVELVGIYFLWNLQKLGWNLYLAAAVVGILLQLILSGIASALGGVVISIIVLGVLYWSLQPVWKKLK